MKDCAVSSLTNFFTIPALTPNPSPTHGRGEQERCYIPDIARYIFYSASRWSIYTKRDVSFIRRLLERLYCNYTRANCYIINRADSPSLLMGEGVRG